MTLEIGGVVLVVKPSEEVDGVSVFAFRLKLCNSIRRTAG